MRQLLPLLLLVSAHAGATELPAPEYRPQEGTVILTIVPDAEEANRLCNPDDDRVFATACSRNTGIIIQSPCDFPHERFARELCHELTHQILHMVHVERGGKLVWQFTTTASK